MESYGIPTGDLESLNLEFLENSRQNQTSEKIAAILQGISGKPAVLSNVDILFMTSIHQSTIFFIEIFIYLLFFSGLKSSNLF